MDPRDLTKHPSMPEAWPSRIVDECGMCQDPHCDLCYPQSQTSPAANQKPEGFVESTFVAEAMAYKEDVDRAPPGAAIPADHPGLEELSFGIPNDPDRFIFLGRAIADDPDDVKSPDPRLGSPQNVLRGLPEDRQDRKETPITTGVIDYFPAAMAAVARLSKAGNDQHNPGEPLHWARGKSADHADCIVRHLIDRGTKDTDGIRHAAKVAWRALALLQEEIEAGAGFDPVES